MNHQETQVRNLTPGIEIQLTNGKTAKYVKSNQTRFVGLMNGEKYTIPFSMFAGVDGVTASTAEPIQKENEEYETLSPGDLFYVEENKRVTIYEFEKFAQTRIHAKNPVTGQRFTVPTSAYGGKVSDLMKKTSKTANSSSSFSYDELPESLHQKFVELTNQLSPENLTCDGELSRAEANRKKRQHEREWARLENLVGFRISESDVWDRVMKEKK